MNTTGVNIQMHQTVTSRIMKENPVNPSQLCYMEVSLAEINKQVL